MHVTADAGCYGAFPDVQLWWLFQMFPFFSSDNSHKCKFSNCSYASCILMDDSGLSFAHS